jgi:DNA end-binding protein Ku
MPRATWKGFLRLSLVICPVYLIPAATKTKAVRLHQVRVLPEPEAETDEEDDRLLPRPVGRLLDAPRVAPRFEAGAPADDTGRAVPASDEPPKEIGSATRIALQPVDRDTGELIERSQLARGYEFDRGQFVTFTRRELKSLDLESSHTIDLTSFVPRAEVDPIYFNAPYYVHPDGKLAAEAFRVIGAAMAEAAVAGIGRVTMARRERQVLVEPRGAGMVLITLRSADEVRPAIFGDIGGDIDAEMVAVAQAIIRRRTAAFDPSTFRDRYRYQEALQELIQAKLKGRVVGPAAPSAPAPVIDLLAALKSSLAQEEEPPTAAKSKTQSPRKTTKTADRRQPSLLLPVAGKRRKREAASDRQPAKRRRKA